MEYSRVELKAMRPDNWYVFGCEENYQENKWNFYLALRGDISMKYLKGTGDTEEQAELDAIEQALEANRIMDMNRDFVFLSILVR